MSDRTPNCATRSSLLRQSSPQILAPIDLVQGKFLSSKGKNNMNSEICWENTPPPAAPGTSKGVRKNRVFQARSNEPTLKSNGSTVQKISSSKFPTSHFRVCSSVIKEQLNCDPPVNVSKARSNRLQASNSLQMIGNYTD